MTSTNYLPGITGFKIYNENNHGHPLIKYDRSGNTEIIVEFVLTGLNQLLNMLSNEPEDFYIYVFLFKHMGGKGTLVESSSYFHCKRSAFNSEFVTFVSSVELDAKSFENDFINNYYSIEIIYSKYEAQDGSDLNFILNNDSNKLIRTKVAFSGESYE